MVLTLFVESRYFMLFFVFYYLLFIVCCSGSITSVREERELVFFCY